MADYKQSKILELGVGWLRKTKKTNEEYISLKLGQEGYQPRQGNYVPGYKVYLVKEGDEDNPVEISGKYLSLFFKKEKKSEKAPDLSACLFED